jgi:hypothetical protein
MLSNGKFLSLKVDYKSQLLTNGDLIMKQASCQKYSCQLFSVQDS